MAVLRGGACCYHRLEVSERGANLRPSPELGDALLELQAAVLGVRELAIEAALWGGYPTNLRKKTGAFVIKTLSLTERKAESSLRVSVCRAPAQ